MSSRNAMVLPWNKGDNVRKTGLQMKAAFKENLLDHMATLDPNTEISSYPLTKMICCVGPLKCSVEEIEQLLESGATTALLPMWMFNQDEKMLAIRNIREAVNIHSMKKDRVIPLGVGIDLRGPLIHTGRLHGNKPIIIETGTVLTLTTRQNWEEHGNTSKVFINSTDLPKQVSPGIDILVDWGKIVVNVGHIVGDEDIVCNVIKGGKLFNNRIVQVPSGILETKEITQNDIDDIEFGIQMGIDFVCISAVQFDCVIKEVRKILDFRKSGILIVAKIENKSGVNNLEEIVKEADAIILVRSSLSVELSEERLFLVQDNVLAVCKLLGKPIYIEGLVLRLNFMDDEIVYDGIINVMDIVTLCQRGIDGLIMRDTLSYGLNTKKVLMRLLNICVLAEPSYWHSHFFNKLSTMAPPPIDPMHAISIAVVEAAMKAGAAAILVCTSSGASAKLICRYLPRVPVIAITRYGRVARQLSLYKAAVPYHYIAPALKDWLKDVDLRFQAGIGLGKELGFIKPGDPLVLLNGWRPGAGFTNTMRMTYASQTDPWIHMKDVGLDSQETEERRCNVDDYCPHQTF